ncbi:MAG: hypothetical protein E7282_04665 [Lachnospiraceae bacterium]|nr:hypothetical protein [Lachnospiraceae bacterium]
MRADYTGQAHEFYEKYGSETVFFPTGKTDGKIYFASRGAAASSGTKYKTIGWKMVISNTSGTVMQNLYFKLGGSYLTLSNSSRKDGYVYNLYSVKLSTILSRLNQKALEQFQKGSAILRLNACMVVSRNGVLSGSMTDSGPSGGQVYTTYAGIVSAADWSSSSVETLKSYFGKEVTGLFFKVKVGKGKGIDEVSGAGTYVYGTKVTIKATCATGYVFSKWTGPSTQTKQSYSFYVNQNCSWIAYATPMKITVTYYRNHSNTDTTRKADTFVYAKTGQKLLAPSWTKTGYTLSGWALERDSNKANYSLNAEVKSSWIVKYYEAVNLYAVWKPNTYTLRFFGPSKDGKTQVICSTIKLVWGDTFVFPKSPGEQNDFAGWRCDSGKTYSAGTQESVKNIATGAGVANTNQAVIDFYALWDSKPLIEAENLYFPLEDAQSGKLTETYLATYFRATDKQDGVISYGIHGTNRFVIENYKQLNLKKMKDRDVAELVLYAKDSDGNEVRKNITLTVVDTAMETPEKVTVRFVDGRFSQEDYYLPADSKWLNHPDYRSLLETATKKEEIP